MADRVVRFILTGDSAGAIKAMADTSVASDATADSLGRTGLAADESGGKFKTLAENLGVPSALLNGWGALGLAAVGVGVSAIKLGEDMQKADTAIAVASGSTVQSATNIGNAFLDTAGKSEFTGEEIAAAYATVAGQLKATEGQTLSTAQATTVMNAAQDLATAKQISLGDATSTLASVMQAFQIPVAGASDAANVLFNASNATGQTIDSLGSSLDKLRSKLGDTSPPLSALASLMVDLTNHGITGRASLTAVNTAMTGLSAAAADSTKAGKAADAALQSFGVSATTASGQLTPMSTIIDALGPKFATMTQEQQLTTAATIFGTSAAKDMVSVIDAGPAAFDAATAAVTRQGAAQSAAAAQSHTMDVEIKTIKATVEDWLTQLGEKLIPVLGKVVQAIGVALPYAVDFLKLEFNGAKIEIEAVINVFKGIVAAGASVVTWFSQTITGAIDTFKSAWDLVWGGVKATVTAVWDVLKPIFDAMSKSISAITTGVSDVSKVASGVKGVAGKVLGAIGLATGGIVTAPTLAVVGENEPEAVIPLSRIPGGAAAFAGNASPLPAGAGSPVGGAAGHTINVYAPNSNPQTIGAEVSWALKLAS